MICDEARALMLVCLTGSTPPDARRALQAHLESCRTCAAEAQGLEETMVLLRAVPDPQLSEAQWAEFSRTLQLRFAREPMTVWARVVRGLRMPRVAWGMAATTVAVVVVLAVTTVFRATPPPVTVADLPTAWRGMVTDSMTRAIPSMATTLDVWTAQLAEAPTATELVEGE